MNDEAGQREVVSLLPHALLRYVERAAGPDALARFVAAQPLSLTQLRDTGRWFTSVEVVALARAAESVCHDRQIGRGAGAEHFVRGCENGLRDLLLSSGSLPAAVTASAHRASKLSTGRRYWIDDIADDQLVLVGEYADLSTADEFYCAYTAGYYERIPSAFGLLGTVAEIECQLRGAPRCRFRLSWRPDRTRAPLGPTAAAAGAGRTELLLAQLEEVRTMTSDLLRVERVDELLATITAQAGRAVQAPRYLLAVRLDGHEEPLVHQCGFRAAEVDRFAQRLLAGKTSEDGGVLSAGVVSAGRHYGRLAACYPRGSTFTDVDRRLLAAYASHAAAVLEHVVALERARCDRDSAASTAARNAELLEQISHQALHDPLTGLANRALLHEHGRKAIQAARRDGSAVAICFVDLDRFKNVNDTLGHAAGDELIRAVSRRIAGTMRDGDTLARLGGDEFLVLLPRIAGSDDALAAAERLVGGLTDPFAVAEREVYVSASVGIACYPDHGSDLDELLRHADAAMYAVKSEGRDGIAVYTDRTAPARPELLRLESELHHSVDGGQLRVFYQPQLDLHDRRVVGVEALVRWEHPRLGLLGPASFLALAEESGLIVSIDAEVRRIAFAQTRSWIDAGHDLRVAVNLCARDLTNPRLRPMLLGEAARAGLPPDRIELEITDRVVLAEDRLTPVLTELADAGFRLAIDDFGTGNSVLGRLNGARINTLKIDQSFVRDITGEACDIPVIRAIVALAASLGIDTVAEGVEDCHQVPVLRRCGARVGQGYLFSRPVPADEVARLLGYPESAAADARLAAAT